MPVIRQMFPSKFLQPEDLPQGRMTAVTITKVVAMQAVYNVQTDQMETTWLLRFAEFNKPAKLKSGLARNIAEVLQIENTDHWIGQRIHVHPGTIEAWGKQIQVICVGPTRPDPNGHKLPPGGEPAAAREPINPKRVIGQAGVKRFLEVCAQFQVALPAFLSWLKARDAELHAACVGKPLEMYPVVVFGRMKSWFDELDAAKKAPPAAASPPVSTGEVVDRSTGEIKSVPAGTLADPAPVGESLDPEDEDYIPF